MGFDGPLKKRVEESEEEVLVNSVKSSCRNSPPRIRSQPASQNNAPLDWILPWRHHFSPSTFSHLLETEFFPKWVRILHAWLSSPDASYEEVYMAWKSFFPPDVVAMPGVAMQFSVGVELMHRSLSLREGESLGAVPKIVPYASIETMKRIVDGGKTKISALPEFQRRKEATLSFRDLVHALGKPLLRLGGAVDGREVGGVLMYIDDAVIFVQEDEAIQAALLRKPKA
ncbi:hypothetical protein BC829DRAFT_450493 [Chytridium lagenaria]|nr:hypothetical protein BC829DRAFT_450493 [Chytridium lagenaria]